MRYCITDGNLALVRDAEEDEPLQAEFRDDGIDVSLVVC